MGRAGCNATRTRAAQDDAVDLARRRDAGPGAGRRWALPHPLRDRSRECLRRWVDGQPARYPRCAQRHDDRVPRRCRSRAPDRGSGSGSSAGSTRRGAIGPAVHATRVRRSSSRAPRCRPSRVAYTEIHTGQLHGGTSQSGRRERPRHRLAPARCRLHRRGWLLQFLSSHPRHACGERQGVHSTALCDRLGIAGRTRAHLRR
jgi:hypothetical protein